MHDPVWLLLSECTANAAWRHIFMLRLAFNASPSLIVVMSKSIICHNLNQSCWHSIGTSSLALEQSLDDKCMIHISYDGRKKWWLIVCFDSYSTNIEFCQAIPLEIPQSLPWRNWTCQFWCVPLMRSLLTGRDNHVTNLKWLLPCLWFDHHFCSNQFEKLSLSFDFQRFAFKSSMCKGLCVAFPIVIACLTWI